MDTHKAHLLARLLVTIDEIDIGSIASVLA